MNFLVAITVIQITASWMTIQVCLCRIQRNLLIGRRGWLFRPAASSRKIHRIFWPWCSTCLEVYLRGELFWFVGTEPHDREISCSRDASRYHDWSSPWWWGGFLCSVPRKTSVLQNDIWYTFFAYEHDSVLNQLVMQAFMPRYRPIYVMNTSIKPREHGWVLIVGYSVPCFELLCQGSNLNCFINRVASHPERLQYIYFNTILLLRAVHRLGPYLSAFDYCSTGKHDDDAETWDRLGKVLTIAKDTGKFDETVLFRGENANVSSHTRLISDLTGNFRFWKRSSKFISEM